MDLPRPWLPSHRLRLPSGERADVHIVHHADELGEVLLAYTRDDDRCGRPPSYRLRGDVAAMVERLND